MSAGTGVYHSEYNHNKSQKVNLLQTWIFPNKKNVTPRYDQKLFAPGERINQLQPLVSPMDNDDAGLKIHQDAWIYRTTLESGKSVTHTLHGKNNGVYVFVIDGKITAGGQHLGKRDAAGITDTEDIELVATTNSDVLILEVPM